GTVRVVWCLGEDLCDVLLLLRHHPSGSFLVAGGLASTPALGVGRQRPLQVGGDANVVNNESALLVFVHTVYAGDGLYEVVAAHRLVDIQRVEYGRVKAC